MPFILSDRINIDISDYLRSSASEEFSSLSLIHSFIHSVVVNAARLIWSSWRLLLNMSRAIQRLMKDYRKAEKLVGRSSSEQLADFASIASLTSQTYAQQMAQLRRDPELTQDEKKYLVAVERKDNQCASIRGVVCLFFSPLLSPRETWTEILETNH